MPGIYAEWTPGHGDNWVQTIPGKRWMTLPRLYGWLEPRFNKTWWRGEIERQSSLANTVRSWD